MKTCGLTLLLLLNCHSTSYGYLPVILLHGIFSDSSHMDDMATMVTKAHPGTTIYNIPGFGNEYSVENMWTQTQSFRKKMLPIFGNCTDGVNMICYSQGGLICRAVLQMTPNHNVKTFVSLSSPQAGQFGDTIYMKYFFPKITRDEVHWFFYSKEGQDISIGNYWRDPRHMDDYMKENIFLPPLNHPNTTNYRDNFVAIEDLVLIGGPDDGIITPWQSSHFDFYDENTEVVDRQKQKYYTDDSFGLRTLDSQGKVHAFNMSGVAHTKWHGNQDVFDKFIEPFLH